MTQPVDRSLRADLNGESSESIVTADSNQLLWLAIEDYSGLWEAVWDLRGLHPRWDSQALLGSAKAALLRLADQDLVQFYRSVEPDGDITDVDRQEIADLLSAAENWNEPTEGSVSIRFGATPAGYAAAGVSYPGRDGSVKYPSMRLEVIDSLESLADLEYQRSHWLDRKVLDSLDLVIHVLYDDCTVLPDPDTCVGTILRPAEVGPLRDLDSRLGPLIDNLGDVGDEVYLDDPSWPSVVAAAKRALAVFKPDWSLAESRGSAPAGDGVTRGLSEVRSTRVGETAVDPVRHSGHNGINRRV